MIIYIIFLCLISLRIIPSRPLYCIIANGKILFFLCLNSILFYIYTCIYMLAHHVSAAPWAVVPQAALSMEFSKQEYWSRLPFPASGDLLTQESNQCISCIGRQILYHSATWEASMFTYNTSFIHSSVEYVPCFDINRFGS